MKCYNMWSFDHRDADLKEWYSRCHRFAKGLSFLHMPITVGYRDPCVVGAAIATRSVFRCLPHSKAKVSSTSKSGQGVVGLMPKDTCHNLRNACIRFFAFGTWWATWWSQQPFAKLAQRPPHWTGNEKNMRSNSINQLRYLFALLYFNVSRHNI